MAQNTPLMPALHDAANDGDAVAVVGLLKDGADHSTISDGATALHIAAREDHLLVAVALLEAGACPDGERGDDKHCEDRTPLHEASARGGAEVIKALLKAGARKDLLAGAADDDDDGSSSALSFALRKGHLEAVRMLVEAGADVNLFGDCSGEPPVVTAVKQGNEDVVLLLLGAGADVNKVRRDDYSGFSALHEAKDVHMMELLLDAGADMEQGIDQQQDGHGCDEGTPMAWLCLKTHQRFSPLQGWRVLKAGAALSSESEVELATAMVQLLLRRGAKIDSKGACVGHCMNTGARGPPLTAAVYNGATAICAALIDAGADLDGTDWELEDFEADNDVKLRPIHDAARFGHVDILRLLLVAGAGANCLSNFRPSIAADEWWGTPLHVACRYSQPECVRELLRWGADVWAEERVSDGGQQEEENTTCQCESCRFEVLGRRKTPAAVIGLRDAVTNDDIERYADRKAKGRLPDTNVAESDEIRGEKVRRELLWWRRCVVILLASRLSKQVSSADDGLLAGDDELLSIAGRMADLDLGGSGQRVKQAGDDELLSIAGRMADLGGSGQGVFRHIVMFL